MPLKKLLLTTSVLLLTGCWNGENIHVRLGDVSIGQQLIDLKTALEINAMTEDEYEKTKAILLAFNKMCEEPQSEDS